MAKFIKCSCENAKYRGYEMHNSPINIELVTQVAKFQEKYYPDNIGTPAISFHGIGKKWVYGENQVAQRDKDYEMIVSHINQNLYSHELLSFLEQHYRYLNIDDQEKAEELIKKAGGNI